MFLAFLFAFRNHVFAEVRTAKAVVYKLVNIIRAKNNTSASTSLETLERKLLRGETFSQVDHIEQDGLATMLDILLAGKTGMEYRPPTAFGEESNQINEREILEDRRRKKETALNSLRTLILYGDEETSEKDYIIEREKIMRELTAIEARLAELRRQESSAAVSSEEFEKYIRKIDPMIPRDFLNNIIQQIVVTDGRVTSISFKNGMTHQFVYKT